MMDAPRIEHSKVEELDLDAVAVAVATAARLTGEDPHAIFSKRQAVRSRHYAAHALQAVFPRVMVGSIARSVGSGSWSSFLSNSVSSVQHGYFKWWDGEILKQVVLTLSNFVNRTGDEIVIPPGLLERIRAQEKAPMVSRRQKTEPPMLPTEPIDVDPAQGRIQHNGRCVTLAGPALQLVRAAVEALPNPVTREWLRETIYPTHSRDSAETLLSGAARTANARICSIGLQLITVPRVGYVLKTLAQKEADNAKD